MPHLQFITGPLAGKRAHLKGARVSLGRVKGNHLRIEHESIAPRHIVFYRDGDDYRLEIDVSRPPVVVNGKQVVKTKLKDGDKLRIGAVEANYVSVAVKKPEHNPLNSWAEPPKAAKEPEVLSLDDAEELPLEDGPLSLDDDRPRGKNWKKILIAFGALCLMLGSSLLLFRKELWKDLPKPVETVQSQPREDDNPLPKDEPPPEEKKEPPPKFEGPAPPIGVGESGLQAGGKIHRTKNFKSHQEAVDAAVPGDAVIFDSPDTKPIVVQNMLRDVQFISGSATWELHADVIDCQFFFHETKQLVQMEGKMERCAFFRCPTKKTHLIHADAVSFYFDESSPLHPKDNPDNGKTPLLQLTGFVRNVLILKPTSGSPTLDKRFDMNWGPSIRIHATHEKGDGRGSYILSPVVFGQRAWTPHQIARGNAVTYAHLTTDNSVWADPVLEILRGDDCVVLCTSLGSEFPSAPEQFALMPKKLKYHDHVEEGHDAPGPAFRGAAMTIQGQRNRIVAHGDARKPWTVSLKMTIPGLHYTDGIVAADPFLKQFATERGGVRVNFAHPRHLFIMEPVDKGAEFLTVPQQADGSPKYTLDGPELHRPTFVPLKDLRLSAGTFDKLQLVDMTGKPMPEIEKALLADKSIFLGPGTYEFKQTLRAGFVAGAGMEQTILKWPEAVDCSQRNCRGLINCTVSGGKHGYNSQLGLAGRVGNPIGLFVRTRFSGQKEAGVNLHTSLFQTWQDCEFVGCRVGFANGLDKTPGVFKGDKGAAGGVTIDNLSLCNCTFRAIKHGAIDLTPNSPKLGHVGIHNCLFEDVGETAIHIVGGQTHLVQLCQLKRCASQTYVPAITIVSNGVLAISHVDVDCNGIKGNSILVSLKGLIALSRCSIKGLPTLAKGITTSLKCEGLLAADHVTADGNLQTPKDSLLCHCRFKNMDLPDGTALAKEKDFTDVTALSLASVLDRSPPPEVDGFKAKTVNKRRRLEWIPVDDAESGIVQYIIYCEGKELARTPFHYEPPSDIHTPLVKTTLSATFTDPNLGNRGYKIVAINGAGLTSEGKLAPPRRLGPARGEFHTREGVPILIKDFTNVKGKLTGITDEEGNKLPLDKVGIKGAPNVVIFEWGEIVEGP